MRTRAQNVRAVVLAAVLALLVLLLVGVVNGSREEVRAQGAAVDFFLKIDGIEGEVTHPGHGGEIEVESWSWGESNSSAAYGSGAGAGKVRMNDFNFTLKASKATPKLMLAGAQGRIIPSATLTVESGGHALERWELKNVVVSNYKTHADRSTGPPTDELRLRFSQIVVTYFEQHADGTTTEHRAGWDLGKAKSI